MKFLFRWPLVVILSILLWPTLVAGESRVALVIGNSDYKEGKLANPVNDARAMAARLQALGFSVVLRENLKLRQIGGVYNEFRSKITPGAVALVFYAGHGLQIKGLNYFPAVDSEITSEYDVATQSLSLGALLDNMEEAKAGVSLVFLDACRDNPYARRFRTSSRGLAKVEAASGTLIHYATKPGSVASDGSGKNGTYTEALLAQISEPNLPVEQMLKRVTNRVVLETKGKQEPWVEGSLRGDFYFIFKGPINVQAQVPIDAEAEAWKAAESAATPAGYKLYLDSYPSGRLAVAARIRLGALETKGATTTQPAASQLTRPGASEGLGEQLTGTLKKIKESGAITIGHKVTSVPFAYLDSRQQPIGYTMDICSAVLEEIKKVVSIPLLTVRYSPATSQTRIPLLESGAIDLECGSTTNTLSRQERVAFSPTIFLTGPKLLVKKSSGIRSYRDLKNMIVAVTHGTTTEQVVKAFSDSEGLNIEFLNFKDHTAAYLSLESGRTAAFAMDDVLLYGIKNKTRSPSSLDVVGDYLSHDPYALMFRKDDLQFAQLVSRVVERLFSNGEATRIYAKWFLGKLPSGEVIGMPMSSLLQDRNALRAIRLPD